MAISQAGPASPSIKGDAHDPILEELAANNTFSSDWPTLRHHLYISLLSVTPVFQHPSPSTSSQVTVPSSASKPIASPPKPSQDAPSDSLLLSPSQPPSTSNAETSSITSSPTIGPEPPTRPAELEPSTQGGLVIAPFPPIDPNRKRRPLVPTIHSQPGPSILGSRPNGSAPHPQLVNALNAARAAANAGSAFDDEWDDDVVIGGKKLPGPLEEDQGKREVERLGKMLEDMRYPPFTIQRLAELLLRPTAQHSNLGKYLRSVEKTLLVTTAWEPPSYNYIPPSQLAGSSRTHLRSSSVSSSSSSSSKDYDDDDTIPPGSTTPMFSPIPFLVRPSDDISEPGDISDRMGGTSNGHGDMNGEEGKDQGLLSPLLLGGEEGESQQNSTAKARSSTPEPEEKGEEDMEIEIDSPVASKTLSRESISTPSPPKHNGTNLSSPSHKSLSPSSTVTSHPKSPNRSIPKSSQLTSTSGAESHDPSHQPYLGIVDELDSGPSIDSGGKGEGGNMVSHGMNNHPVPLSSTTDLHPVHHPGPLSSTPNNKDQSERTIASLPRSSSVSSLSGMVRSGTEGDLKSLGERFVSSGQVENGKNDEEMIVDPSENGDKASAEGVQESS